MRFAVAAVNVAGEGEVGEVSGVMPLPRRVGDGLFGELEAATHEEHLRQLTKAMVESLFL